MRLDQLQIGKRARIQGVFQYDHNLERLYAMGLVPGEEVELIRAAPLGDPILVRIMGYELCLRRDCAANIRIRPI